MTEQEMDVEQEEIERMKNLLRTSSEHLSHHEVVDQDGKQARTNKRRKLETDKSGDQKREKELCSIYMEDNISTTEGDDIKYTTDDTDIILPSKKKKLPRKSK
jgi:hypothetical protein